MGYKHHKPIQQLVDNNAALDRKLKSICFDLKPAVQYLLFALSNQDKELLADFILAWQERQGRGRPMATLTKRSYITTLVYLSRYRNGKLFRDMIREDIIDGYLASLRTFAKDDPDERWINTCKARAARISAFFKWLTQPDVEPDARQLPPQLKGLRYPRRKAKTSVKHDHL